MKLTGPEIIKDAQEVFRIADEAAPMPATRGDAAPETWLVLGASSAIGRAFAREVAARGADVLLAGRDQNDLETLATDIALRSGLKAEAIAFDATDAGSHARFALEVAGRSGTLNVCLVFGLMPSQAEMDADVVKALDCIAATYTGAVSVLHHLAPVLERQGRGRVVVFGSVAGERGRIKNYVYGSAKAGLHTYVQGLRNRLFRSGVSVTTVKPGFVDTAMTWGQPGLFLVAEPESIARSAIRAAQRGAEVLYFPRFWWLVMTIIKLVPETIFKRLNV